MQREDGFRICQQLLQSVELAESIGRPEVKNQNLATEDSENSAVFVEDDNRWRIEELIHIDDEEQKPASSIGSSIVSNNSAEGSENHVDKNKWVTLMLFVPWM